MTVIYTVIIQQFRRIKKEMAVLENKYVDN